MSGLQVRAFGRQVGPEPTCCPQAMASAALTAPPLLPFRSLPRRRPSAQRAGARDANVNPYRVVLGDPAVGVLRQMLDNHALTAGAACKLLDSARNPTMAMHVFALTRCTVRALTDERRPPPRRGALVKRPMATGGGGNAPAQRRRTE